MSNTKHIQGQITINFDAQKLLFGVYTFNYHLLRVGTGEMSNTFWHINSIWSGYNDSDYPSKELDKRMSTYLFADSPNDIIKIIHRASASIDPRKTFFIMARFDDYHKMSHYIN